MSCTQSLHKRAHSGAHNSKNKSISQNEWRISKLLLTFILTSPQIGSREIFLSLGAHNIISLKLSLSSSKLSFIISQKTPFTFVIVASPEQTRQIPVASFKPAAGKGKVATFATQSNSKAANRIPVTRCFNYECIPPPPTKKKKRKKLQTSIWLRPITLISDFLFQLPSDSPEDLLVKRSKDYFRMPSMLSISALVCSRNLSPLRDD